MSYTEYKDLFKKCQSYAQYHLFIYYIVNSRKETNKDRQNNLIHLLFKVYEELENLEKSNNMSILYRSEDLYYTKLKKGERGYCIQQLEEKSKIKKREQGEVER